MTHDGAAWAAALPLTYFKTVQLRRTSPAAAELSAPSTALTLSGANLFSREIPTGYHTNLLCRLTPLRHPTPDTPPPAANLTTNETLVLAAELVGTSEARCHLALGLGPRS